MKRELLTYFCLLCILVFSVVFFACGSDSGGGDDPEPPQSEKIILEFGFEPSVNVGLTTKLEGTFMEEAKVIAITTPLWLDNLNALKATFKAVGTVKVNGEEQVSGASVQDFTKEVIYTVTAQDGSVREYTILFRSPQTTGHDPVPVAADNRPSGFSDRNEKQAAYHKQRGLYRRRCCSLRSQ